MSDENVFDQEPETETTDKPKAMRLPAALFSDEPTWQDFPELGGRVRMLPVDGDLDVEYTRRRGFNSQTFEISPPSEKGQRATVTLAAQTVSNDQQIAANRWIIEQIVSDWELTLDTGAPLPFDKKTRSKLGAMPAFAAPIINRGYELARIVEAVESGN